MKNQRTALDMIKIIKKYEPLYLILMIPRIIISSILPVLIVYFPKLIIDRLIADEIDYKEIFNVVIIYILILLVTRVIQVYLQSRMSFIDERFSLKLKKEIGSIASEVDLEDVEKTSFKDIVIMGSKASTINQTLDLVQIIITNILTLLSLAYIIAQLDLLFFIIVSITFIVKSSFVYYVYRYNKKIRTTVSSNTRVLNYLNNAAYNHGSAKELRTNNLQEWFLKKVSDCRDEMVKIQYKDFNRYAMTNIIMKIIMAVQSALVLWLLAIRYIDGVITIADFTLYFSSVTTLTVTLNNISDKIGNYKQQMLNLLDYKKLNSFVTKPTKIMDSSKDIDLNNFSNISIKFKDVSFKYPSTEKYVLKNINLTIDDHEKLVIVGLNGAGKSTLIKLLCKFYKPVEGEIYINDINIWDIPNEKYNKIIGAVFQDYAYLSFMLKENVSFSEDSNMELVEDVITNVGLNEFIESLENKYDTYLYKNYNSSGIELSGGQSQKLAIARAMYKEPSLLILDEPTASLDPRAENEIYINFYNISKDKTTIFISHRLAASTIADKIIVLNEGEIIEYGSHNELMRKDGFYATMYKKQSEAYKY